MSPFPSPDALPPVGDNALSSRPASLNPAAAATRCMPEADAAPPSALSAPASQESFASLRSAQSSVVANLETSSSSNASQWTGHTDLPSPKAGVPSGHLHTPNAAQLHVDTGRQHDKAPTSPVVTSPVTTNGAKRTASGSVKHPPPSLPNTPLSSAFPGRRPRTDSMSSAGSRAGDLALSLKTRLEYAMAKVQHGWEHKNIHEVERLARHQTSPGYRHSMSHLDYTRRPTTMGNGSTYAPNRFFAYETNGHYVYESASAFQPSKRHSGTYGSFISSSQPTLGSVPRLQPAADIQPAFSSQPLRSDQRIPQYRSASPNGCGNIMSPPRTPVNGASRGRPPTLRTELQTAEAEREALQALFQLGSPHGSHVPSFQRTSQVSSSQGSSLRSESKTPRKVTFARSESDSSAGHLSSEECVGEEVTHQMVEV